jgi:hypothetical protein
MLRVREHCRKDCSTETQSPQLLKQTIKKAAVLQAALPQQLQPKNNVISELEKDYSNN